MAESFIQLNNDGPGKQVDTWTESTNGHHRQAMVIADPSITLNVANVTAAGALKTDASATTQPISGSITVLNASLPVTQSGVWTTGRTWNLLNTTDSVNVGNFPATQPISGTVTANIGTTNGLALDSTVQFLTVAQATAIGSLKGPMIQAYAVTGPTSYTSGNVYPLTQNLNGYLKVDGSNVTQPISGTVNQGTPASISSPWPVALSDDTNLLGTPTHPLRIDPTGTTTQPVSLASTTITGTVAVTESGTWTVQPGNTANTTPWLATINQGGNSASVNATNELLVTDTDLTLTPGSTTSGQLGPLVQGAVTTAAPTYSTAQTNPLSLTTAGALRTDASATTQPVSGTVTANQGTANATPWNENIAQIGGTTTSTAAAGTQKVGISGATAATLDGVITAATAPANGLATLAVNNTTPPSLTTGQSVALQCDYEGSLFVKPMRRSQLVSKATTIAASTTTATVLPAQAAGVFADITNLWISVAQTTTVTAMTCTLSDGTNSYVFDVETGVTTTGTPGLGVNINFQPPLPATTAATAWTITNSSATPTVHITVVAVLQKAS